MQNKKAQSSIDAIELSIFETELAGILGIISVITPFLFVFVVILALLASSLPENVAPGLASLSGVVLGFGALLDGYFMIRMRSTKSEIKTKYVNHTLRPGGKYSLIEGIFFVLYGLMVICAAALFILIILMRLL